MKKRGTKSLSLYSNLSNRRKANRDYKTRRKAEYLASLPKHPLKRILYRLHPKRFFAYWFSKEGAFMALKLAGIGFVAIVLMIGILFVYYRRELDAIKPDEISKRVQTTVTRYVDRNGVLLWEDKGDGNYKLVVKSEEISKYMKDATVAIEDKDFYQHKGFSLSGITRAAWSNFTNEGGSTQGGSTLTQQLIKQVFFADEAGNRGLSGVPRKIKEVILSVQIENIYNKDQILTMYLNESPYGGRRNGVESAAQTYFEKSAKDLTLAEASFLASIPQNPNYFNPYTLDTDGRKALTDRQKLVLDYMADQGYITKPEAVEAKKISILDAIKPEAEQFKGVKAPHFVQMVKGQLEAKLGKKTVGDGGLTVKTTLDYRVQEIVEREMTALFQTSKPRNANFDNGAATMVDSQTGQILALMGSRDYNYPDYGAVNSSVAYIQPGSSIKPFVFASLFKERTGVNYGAGSILADEAIPQSVYKTDDGKSVNNFDNRFRGSIPIRSGLAESRNIPAIKAMYLNDQVNGDGDTLKTIRAMGDTAYCSKNSSTGLALSIGGCELLQTEHANTFATIARMGVYKPVASVLEVKNSQGQIIDQWKDEPKEVISPQITYMLADILSDDTARSPSFGRGAAGLNVPGVKTGTKTGTSNLGNWSKDLWMNSFSPKATLSFWVGNHDSRYMSNALSSLTGPTVGNIMRDAHTTVFQPDGTWKPGDWFTEPAGIQRLSVNGRTDLYPSWYKKTTVATTGEKIVFDRVSKKKATTCTPDAAKIEVTVQSVTDPVTKKKTFVSTDGYDPNADDDLHKCTDIKPFVNSITISSSSGDSYTISASVTQGTHALQTITFTIGGTVIGTASASSSGSYSITYTPSSDGPQTVTATVTDSALYSAALDKSHNFN